MTKMLEELRDTRTPTFKMRLLSGICLMMTKKNSTSISEFKRKLLAMIRPNKNLIYGINDIVGVRHLYEDSEHFLLHCPFFDEARRDLLVSLSDIPGLDIAGLDAQSLCHLILFGNPDLTLIAKRMIMEATIDYIEATKRLD